MKGKEVRKSREKKSMKALKEFQGCYWEDALDTLFDDLPGSSWLDYAIGNEKKNTTIVKTKKKKTELEDFFFDPSYCQMQTNTEVRYNEREQELLEEVRDFCDDEWFLYAESAEDNETQWDFSCQNRGWVDYTSPEMEEFAEIQADEKNAMIEFEKERESREVSCQCDLGCLSDEEWSSDLSNNDEQWFEDSKSILMLEDQDEVLMLEDLTELSDCEGNELVQVVKKLTYYDDEPWMASMFDCDEAVSVITMKAMIKGYTFTGVGIAPCNAAQFREFSSFLEEGLKSANISQDFPIVYLGNIYNKGGYGCCDIILTNNGENVWNSDTSLRLVYGSDCGVGETEVAIGCVDKNENVGVQICFGSSTDVKKGLSIWALCSGGEVFGTAVAVMRV